MKKPPYANQQREKSKYFALTYLSLLFSLSTVFCCAVPITLVFLGFGATLATLYMHLPYIDLLNEYKFPMFISCGLLLLYTDWLLRKPSKACELDTEQALSYQKSYQINRTIVNVSMMLWFIGFIAAYISLPVYKWISVS